MIANFLALYLKLNILLIAALLLWLFTKQLARLFRFEVSHAQQLKVARMMFAGLLFAVPLIVLIKMLMPEWVKGMVAAVSGTGIIQEFTFTAGANEALVKNYQFGKLSFDTTLLISVLLSIGLLLHLAKLTMQLNQLRKILADATQWKSIHGIHLLISPSITSPFSTRALGSKQIVLPAQLLETPRNLQLAIKHELQHARNGDLEWVILLEAVKALCFWNPAAWLWQNEFDCLQEFACDDVLVNERRVNSQAYGYCLLEVASVVSGQAMLASSNMVPKFSFLQNHKNQLKRRILMLGKNSDKKNMGLKTLCYSLLIGCGSAGVTAMVLAAETGKTNAQAGLATEKDKTNTQAAPAAEPDKQSSQMKLPPVNQDVFPLTRPQPEYPMLALSRGIEGSVVMEFTIDEQGSVQDAIVVQTCSISHSGEKSICAEDNTFREAALTALRQWKYPPYVKNGKAAKRERVQTMLKFQLEADKDQGKPENK